MHRQTLSLTLVTAVAAFALSAVSAVAAPLAGDEWDRLARRLERDARELREEVLVQFRERPGHKELEGHVREIERLAELIHSTKEREGRSRHVREILDKIDEEVRQIDRQVQELGRFKDINRKSYDHVRDELADMGRILYRMRKEL